MPVAPYETESAMEAPCDGHGRTLAMEALNLIPVFAFDFPCLRPPPRRRQRQSVSRFAKAPNAGEWRRGAGHPFHETPEMNGAGAGKDRRGPVDYPYVWSGVACWPMERGSPPPGRGFREGVGGAGKEWR